MKTPFPAILIELHGAPYHSVMARRCTVLELFPARREACVSVGTALNSGVRMVAKYSQLATTEERARWMLTDALQSITHRGASDPAGAAPFLEPNTSPASDEKSAIPATAGAGA